MKYERKTSEELGLYDRVAIRVEPECPMSGKLHGWHHKQVNELTGRIEGGGHGDGDGHIWRVVYDTGHFGYHTPAELRDLIADVIEENGGSVGG